MDASWNNISTDPTVLQQIASDLGYNSVDELPPVNTLSADQVATLTIDLPPEVADKLLDQDYDYQHPTLDDADIDTNSSNLAVAMQKLIADLTAMLSDMMNKVSNMTIKELKEQCHERIQKCLDAVKKATQKKKGAFWQKFGAWAGAVAGFLGALALTVVTGGAAVPALIVAGVALGLQIAEATGGMDKLMTAMFGDDEKAKMIFSLCLSAVILVAGIATGAYAAKAASSVTEISSLCKGLATLAKVSDEAMQAGAKVAGIGATVVGILSSIGGGAAQIDVAFATYDEKQLRADIKKIVGMIDSLKADLREINKKMQKIFQFYTQFGSELPNSMLDDVEQTTQKVLTSSPA